MPFPQTIRGRKGAAIVRRQQVAKLRRQGITSQKEIARRTGYSAGVICRDFKLLDEEWLAQAEIDTDKHITRALKELDELQGAVWPAAIQGNVKAVQTALKILESRRRLLGLDAPEKREISGPDGEPIEIDERITLTQQERDSRIIAIIEAAQARASQQAMQALPEPPTPAELLERLRREQQNGWHDSEDRGN